MDIIEISKMNTCFKVEDWMNIGYEAHESLLRSYNILQVVKHYLGNDVPNHIILELIGVMEIPKTSS